MILERRPMGQQKYQIIELIRRMINIQVNQVEIEEKLNNCGYRAGKARDIVVSGLRDWKNKWEKRISSTWMTRTPWKIGPGKPSQKENPGIKNNKNIQMMSILEAPERRIPVFIRMQKSKGRSNSNQEVQPGEASF